MWRDEEPEVTGRPAPLPQENDQPLRVVSSGERERSRPTAAEPRVDDRALVHAARAGDDAAFGALVRLHQRRAYAVARIVANAALDLVRRRRVRVTEELPAGAALPFRDPAESAELRARLNKALAGLPARQRAVLVLHDVEGYRHAEIGEMLGMPEGTARSDLHHARTLMRRALDDLRNTR